MFREFYGNIQGSTSDKGHNHKRCNLSTLDPRREWKGFDACTKNYNHILLQAEVKNISFFIQVV